MSHKSLQGIFEERADSSPQDVAVLFEGRTTTYSELESSANRLAAFLRKHGFGRDARVALLLPRTLRVYVSILGTLKSGAAYVPIDPGYPPDRVRFILEDSRCNAVITDSELAHLVSGFKGSVVNLDTDWGEIEAEDPTRPDPAAEDVGQDLCYIIYTSGTSGRPKGVEIEHRNVVHLVSAEREIYKVVREDRVCQAASLSFDLSVEEVWLAFAAGATLVPAPPDSSHVGPEFSSFLNENHVTVLSCVPTMLSTIADELPEIRLLILGGEACPQRLVDRWARKGRRLFNTYGPTEATVIATFAELRQRIPVTIGKAVPGYYIRLLDESLSEVPTGSPGEICIGGPGIARGYVNLPKETGSKFVADPFSKAPDSSPRLYRTGDLGRFRDDGNLEFLGRADDQVKLRGYRIELSEIESVIMKQPGVLAAACTVRVGAAGVQTLVAYVVMDGGAQLDERKLRTQLLDSLPAFMVPSLIDRVADLPKLPSGKLDRGSLPAPRARKARRLQDSPKTRTERKLAKVWSNLFSPQPVSVTDDFFLDLGGHSLLAARMVSEIRNDRRFSNVSVADVYENPTVRSLASLVDKRSERLIVPSQTIRGAFSHREDEGHVGLGVKVIQAIGLYLSFGVRAAEWVTPYLVFFLLILSGHSFFFAAGIAIVTAVLVFPILLLVALAAKWAILGRIRPGRHPLWGRYYLRWWFVQSLVSALPLDYLAGTPLLPAVYRLFGVGIGRDVHIESHNIKAFDAVTIGDGTSVDEDASLLGYSVEGGELVIGEVLIGRHCYVGTRSVLREGAVMEDGARLEDLSLLRAGERIPENQTWAGSPARPTEAKAPPLPPPPARGRLRRAVTPLLYGALVMTLPVLVLMGVFPGVLFLLSIDTAANPLLYFLAVPLVGVSFVFIIMGEFVLLKWALVGRVKPGIYPLDSSFYIRNWVVDQMHSLSLDLVAPLHATMYLAPWYRALGARIGKSVELSTATSTTPDLLELGDESTVADEVSLGSPHTEGGWMSVGATVLGRRSFVGNSAVIPAGTILGDRTLCGVLSIPPSSPDGSAQQDKTWLGSPPIELPRRQPSQNFLEERTFRPTRKMRLVRGTIESLRVTLPPAGFIVVTTFVIWSTLTGIRLFGLLPALVLVPLAYASACVFLAVFLVIAKWTVIGRYRPFEKPLWTAFIWRLELINALYEFLVTPLALEPLQGTPFLPGYERLMGSRIGRDVYVHTTGFLEWDLVEIGDLAALNEDCVLQTHLFEDRVLKASHLRVGRGCDVGAYSVVLYESEMQEGARLDALSLLMKGETLPAHTSWLGIPAESGGEMIELVETTN